MSHCSCTDTPLQGDFCLGLTTRVVETRSAGAGETPRDWALCPAFPFRDEAWGDHRSSPRSYNASGVEQGAHPGFSCTPSSVYLFPVVGLPGGGEWSTAKEQEPCPRGEAGLGSQPAVTDCLAV